MPENQYPASRTPGLTFGRIASTIAVSSLPRARFLFWLLGMQITFQNGDPLGFVILERDSTQLHLIRVTDHRAATSQCRSPDGERRIRPIRQTRSERGSYHQRFCAMRTTGSEDSSLLTRMGTVSTSDNRSKQ